MARAHDPARTRRARLLLLEQREKAQAEARAVAEGVAETVALARARGAAIERPATGRGEREAPYRRQAGLDWLARKGRITEAQKAAGARYGACYRRAEREPAIPSTLEVSPGAGLPGGAPLSAVLAHAEATAKARAKLAFYRRQLSGQPDLIAACDLVCGRELTPREAGGGERGGGRIEAVLRVALDILAAAAEGATPRESLAAITEA